MQKDKIKEIAAGVKTARAEGLHPTENRGIYTAEDHAADVRDYMLGNLLDGKEEKMPPAIDEEAVKRAQVILQEYKAAKLSLYEECENLVINADDRTLFDFSKGKKPFALTSSEA